MKTIPLRFVKGHSLGHNSSIGDHYRAKCPYCSPSSHQPLLWMSEFKDRAFRADTTNVCVHVDGVTKEGKLKVRPKMSVKQRGLFVTVNGVHLDKTLPELVWELDELEGDIECGRYMTFPPYAPRRRFDAVREEVERVYKAKSDEHWDAVAKAVLEHRERAELARLRAKYE